MKVLHITDPHLFADRQGELRGVNTYDSFATVLDAIRERRLDIDVIALTGDLIQDDTREAYEHFHGLLDDFATPVLALPGNHDVPAFMREALSSPPFSYCGDFARDNWLLTAIDSTIENDAGGCVAPGELARLEQTLAGTRAEHVVVCLHHPPVPMNSAWLDTVGLRNRDEFLGLLERHEDKVRGVLFGHVHQACDETIGGLRIIGTPSTCRQFKPHADTFAVDDEPPAYRLLKLHFDGLIESNLVKVHQEGAAHATQQ